jgi:[glutamine synthetase] adenylyltransferase / [glutamine synthetase]-adenylyl-L-tyrosine phosphorylase
MAVSEGTDKTDSGADFLLERVNRFSRFGKLLLSSRPQLREEIERGRSQPFSVAEMQDWLESSRVSDEISLKVALRTLRQRVLLRVMARDLGGLADLLEVTLTMTCLAETALRFAQLCCARWLEASHGIPIGAESGTGQQLIIVAMGKLGAQELNVSSDIDLIFVYPEEGEVRGARRLGNREFFALLGRRLIAAMQEPTEDGIVFRVDMRLRPYGDSGALAVSLNMLENYLLTQGRPWERFAWIKAHAITGERCKDLVALAHPFVFRRYLDFAAIAAMRDLHRQIHDEVRRRDRPDDIKLGPGGIREIEFIAQVFQLVRGGRDPDLQARPTLAVLECLAQRALLPHAAALELKQAYVFLRTVEHRLQYADDAQTHALPAGEEDKELLAEAMNFARYADFREQLDSHRSTVTRHFEAVFETARQGPEVHPSAQLWHAELAADEAATRLRVLGYSFPEQTWQHLAALRRSNRYEQLPGSSRERLDALMPGVIASAARQPHPDETLDRTLDLIAAISRRETYLALMLEHPQTLDKIAELASASSWAINYLKQYPILLDELLDHRQLHDPVDWAALGVALETSLQQLDGDAERQLDALRHFKQSIIFRLVTQDLAGLLSVEALSDHLSALADLLLAVTLRLAWNGLKQAHRKGARFAIIGFGKLGGKELGYGSDLDIIFLYDDPAPNAGEIYARLAQRINSLLSAYTAGGVLYQTDLRLRPDGASGLLVSSVTAFETYQRAQAWVWEHQALTRARFCAGDEQVGAGFEQIRERILRQTRDLDLLRSEIDAMRQRMRIEHANRTALFDLKHDRGGLVDVEFIVQYLVLAHSHRHPELTRNAGNIALLNAAGTLGLITQQSAQRNASAYREFRRLQHRAWMNEDAAARVEMEAVAEHAAAVCELWQWLFARGEPSSSGQA